MRVVPKCTKLSTCSKLTNFSFSLFWSQLPSLLRQPTSGPFPCSLLILKAVLYQWNRTLSGMICTVTYYLPLRIYTSDNKYYKTTIAVTLCQPKSKLSLQTSLIPVSSHCSCGFPCDRVSQAIPFNVHLAILVSSMHPTWPTHCSLQSLTRMDTAKSSKIAYNYAVYLIL